MATWSELPSIRIGSGVGQEWVPQFWSPEIFHTASENIELLQYCHRLEKFGVGQGQTWFQNKFGTLGTRGGTLAAGTKILITNLPTYQVAGTINAMGNGIKIEERILYLSPYDLESQGARYALAEDMRKTIDGLIRKEILSATTNYVYGGTWATIGAYPTALGTIGTAANFPMSLGAIRRLSKQFRTKKVPKLKNQAWVLFMHPDQVNDLFADASTTGGFVDITKYSERQYEAVAARTIGRLYGFDIAESTFVAGTTEKQATGTVQTIDAMAIGGNDADPALLFAWAKEPEIRYEPDYDTDFFRTQALAWLADGGARLYTDEYLGIIKSASTETIEENNKLA